MSLAGNPEGSVGVKYGLCAASVVVDHPAPVL